MNTVTLTDDERHGGMFRVIAKEIMSATKDENLAEIAWSLHRGEAVSIEKIRALKQNCELYQDLFLAKHASKAIADILEHNAVKSDN